MLGFRKNKNQPDKEQEMLQGCLKGDRRYQQTLYNAYSQKMYGVCLGYTKDKDAAKDVLQDAFIKVFNNICNYNNQGSLEGWIRRIVVNTAIDYYRRASKIHIKEVSDIHTEPVENEVLEDINQEELLEMIRRLPDGYRLVFNLSVVEGFTHEEIAAQLEISESTVRSQLSRARKLLQEWIKETDKSKFVRNAR